MSKILGGRHEEEWRGELEFPLRDGDTYALNVHLRALHPQDRTRLAAKYARRSKRGNEYLSMADSPKLGAALLNHVLVDWPAVNGNQNPVGAFCRSCNRWVTTDTKAKLYEIDHCRCDDPDVELDDDGHVVGRQYPCKHPWPLFVVQWLEANVDASLMPTDEDGDPMSVSAVILEKAADLAAGGGELTGDAEGN